MGQQMTTPAPPKDFTTTATPANPYGDTNEAAPSAASFAAPPPAPDFPSEFATPPPPAPDFGGGGDQPPAESTGEPIKMELPANPGPLEDLHKKVKEIMPLCFEGGRISINKGLSSFFSVSHTITMNQPRQSGYRFGATYVALPHPNAQEPSTILMGDIDPSGNLNAHCIAMLAPNLRAKFITNFTDNKCQAGQFFADYRGNNFTATMGAVNVDFKGRSGVLLGQYFQNVYERVALGFELIYQYAPQVPGGIAVPTVSGRYTGDQFVVAGSLGLAAVHASYYLRNNETTQVGVEVETNMRNQESVATLGYQFDAPKANLVFRGMVNSNWEIGAVFEKKLNPLPFTFGLSAMMNHAKCTTKVGFALTVG